MVSALSATLLSIFTLADPVQAPGAPVSAPPTPSTCSLCPDTVELAIDGGGVKASRDDLTVSFSLTGGWNRLRLGLAWTAVGGNWVSGGGDDSQVLAARVGLRSEVEPQFFVDLDAGLGVRRWQVYYAASGASWSWSEARYLPDASLALVFSTDMGSRFFRWGFGGLMGWSGKATRSGEIPGSPVGTVSGATGGDYYGGFIRIVVGKVNRR
jgi:hypothetical protein